MSLADAVAAVMLAALVVYVVTGGADFGGGVWDLFAAGPRRKEQRALVEQALAPVWEANHVWLILVVVLLFTAFPPAFAAASTALHIPLTAMLVGVVLRGSAFVFRQYGGGGAAPGPAIRGADGTTSPGRSGSVRFADGWGRVFAVSSVVTPVFLGVCLGAVSGGELRFEDGLPVGGFFASWATAFPFAVGGFVLALFAFLAAVYLTVEAQGRALQDDFRLRAIAAQMALGLAAVVVALTAGAGARPFTEHLFGAWWSAALQVATAVCAVGSLGTLWMRRFRTARVFAIGQASMIVVGWGAAQYPFLIRPGMTLAGSAAPDETLRLLLPTLGGGALILIPSLYWLMRLFKSHRRANRDP